MSDGPYRSLSMSRPWKRLARFAENENFENEDLREAASDALKETWQINVPVAVVDGVRKVFFEHQSGLLFDPRAEELRLLSSDAAGSCLGKLLLDQALQVLENGETGQAGLIEAAERTLMECGARASRQIDEHYLRKTRAPLAKRVHERVGQALDDVDMRALASQLCGLKPCTGRRRFSKHQDVNDGVPL